MRSCSQNMVGVFLIKYMVIVTLIGVAMEVTKKVQQGVFIMCRAPIPWCSKKQSGGTILIRREEPMMLIDNKSVINLAKHPVAHTLRQDFTFS
ncbi:hypothetical protein CR513_13545, partial [Mucuna pruriens]